MKCEHVILVGILLVGMGLMSSCAKGPQPQGALSVSELLQDPLYDTEVTVYGQVSLLEEIKCPCFELTSGGKTVQVWYAWYEGDWPTVSVEGIQNGDQVLVTGELKTAGVDHLNEFAASKIVIMMTKSHSKTEVDWDWWRTYYVPIQEILFKEGKAISVHNRLCRPRESKKGGKG